MKYQKAIARITIAAMPPTTPPTIAPVLLPEDAALVAEGDAGLLEDEFVEELLVGVAVAAGVAAGEVDTSAPSTMYTPRRSLQQSRPLFCVGSPQQRLKSPHCVIGTVALALMIEESSGTADISQGWSQRALGTEGHDTYMSQMYIDVYMLDLSTSGRCTIHAKDRDCQVEYKAHC